MNYEYHQWNWGWLTLGIGFDPQELTEVQFELLACVQHREFVLNLALFGLMFDLYITEPL